jgi:hypothetical protein
MTEQYRSWHPYLKDEPDERVEITFFLPGHDEAGSVSVQCDDNLSHWIADLLEGEGLKYGFKNWME